MVRRVLGYVETFSLTPARLRRLLRLWRLLKLNILSAKWWQWSHIPPANDLYGGFLSVIDIYFQSGGEAGLWLTNSRWQLESLVNNVPKHSQVSVILTSMCRPTVESKGTIAHLATNHLVKLFIWRPTPSFTLGRNRTSATNAAFQPIMLSL